MTRPTVKLPTNRQGQAATDRGLADAKAGLDQDHGPWSMKSGDSVEATLAVCYQRGYAYGMQQVLQQRYGDAPVSL